MALLGLRGPTNNKHIIQSRRHIRNPWFLEGQLWFLWWLFFKFLELRSDFPRRVTLAVSYVAYRNLPWCIGVLGASSRQPMPTGAQETSFELGYPCGSVEVLCRNSRNVARDGCKKRLERGPPLFLKVFDRFRENLVEFRDTKGLRFLSAFLGTAP